MNECRDYELEISALLDGESDPSTAWGLLEHVGACASCGTFVRDIGAAQATIDRAYSPPGSERTESARPSAGRTIGYAPRWAWGIAATIVLAVGGYVAAEADSTRLVNKQEDTEVFVRLGDDPDAMNDDRFMELTTELLRADRLYRDQMYLVLDAVRTGERSGERGASGEINRFGEAEDDGRPGLRSANALD